MVLILAVIIYCRPKALYKEMTVYSLEGESVHMILNISRHRFLLKPTEVKGEVIVNGQRYISIVDGSGSISKGDFFERIKNKLTGYEYPNTFRKNIIDSMESARYTVTLNLLEEKFDVFRIDIIEDGKYTIYFGPAKSVEEVKLILEYFN